MWWGRAGHLPPRFSSLNEKGCFVLLLLLPYTSEGSFRGGVMDLFHRMGDWHSLSLPEKERGLSFREGLRDGAPSSSLSEKESSLFLPCRREERGPSFLSNPPLTPSLLERGEGQPLSQPLSFKEGVMAIFHREGDWHSTSLSENE